MIAKSQSRRARKRINAIGSAAAHALLNRTVAKSKTVVMRLFRKSQSQPNKQELMTSGKETMMRNEMTNTVEEGTILEDLEVEELEGPVTSGILLGD